MVLGDREALLKRIGTAVREHRLRKNLPQKVVAERSGVSLTALKRLESGAGATLGTFAQVCRTLGQDWWIRELESKDDVSPIAYVDALNKSPVQTRRRAHV